MTDRSSEQASKHDVLEDFDDPQTNNKNVDKMQTDKPAISHLAIKPVLTDDVESITSPMAPSRKDIITDPKSAQRIQPSNHLANTNAQQNADSKTADQSLEMGEADQNMLFGEILRAVVGTTVANQQMPNTNRKSKSNNDKDMKLQDFSDISQINDDDSDKERVEEIMKASEAQADPQTKADIYRRYTTAVMKQWPKDSFNGQLSHSKMVYEVNQTHPRKRKEGKTKPMPCCGSHSGFFCCCKKCRRNENVSQELGSGMTIYFKTMKSFIFLFFVFTIMSLPAYYLYWNGTPIPEGESITFSDSFGRLTLGNIGQSTEECGEAEYEGDTFELYCSFGQMHALNIYAVSSTDQGCSDQALAQEGAILDGCDIASSESVLQWFSDNCLGKQRCDFTSDYSEFPSTCLANNPNMYALTTCIGGDISLPFTDQTVTRTQLTFVVIGIDIAICISYFIFLQCLQTYTKLEQYEINDSKLSITDFCVTVKDLPDVSEYQTLDNLKVMLQKHFRQLLPDQRQRIKSLQKEFDHDVGDIANIHFGHTNFEGYEILLKIEKCCLRVALLEEKQKKSPKSHQKFQKQIDKIKLQVIKLQDKYMQMDLDGTKDQIKTAYVVFKSMEGAERTMHAYNMGFCNRLCLKCCCRGKELKPKLFQNRWLNITRAVDPTLIMWQNLGSRKRDRCCRTTITSIVAFVLCLATIAAILYAKDIDTQSNEFAPTTNCPTEFEITRDMAYEDYKEPANERNGYMPCYCKAYWIEGVLIQKATSYLNQEFPDGEAYCMSWFESYAIQQSLLLAIPLIISLTNSISKTVMRCLAKFEKSQSKAEEVYTSTRNMMLISFINTGLVILIINFDFTLPDWLSWFPIFNGNYTKFSVGWYKTVGATLAVTMLFFIVTPHISNCMFQALGGFNRCCDRGCRCDSKRTRKLTQTEYENINMGNEFLMEFRYSNILTVVIITMMYSPGLPLLYPIACAFFMVTYYVDKCMLLKMYRKPVLFDNTLALSILFWFNMAMVLHSLMGIFMLSNTSILPTSSKQLIDYEVILGETETTIIVSWSDLFSYQMVLYWGIFVILILIACFRATLLGCCIKCFSQCRKAAEVNHYSSDNFFKDLSYPYLRKEYSNTSSQIKKYEELLRIGQVFKPQLTEIDMNKYIRKLDLNLEAIIHQIKEIARQQGLNPDEYKDKLFNDLLTKLDGMHQSDKMNQQGNLINSVESYDILELSTFDTLQDLKKLLDKRSHSLMLEQLSKQ